MLKERREGNKKNGESMKSIQEYESMMINVIESTSEPYEMTMMKATGAMISNLKGCEAEQTLKRSNDARTLCQPLITVHIGSLVI